MTSPPTCTRCHQRLTSPVWSDSGAAYGLTCARRMGLVREPARRDSSRGGVRVPRTGGDDERQVELFGTTEGFDYASTPFREWPWVRDHREAHAGDPRRVEGCDGCETFGLCAWHATSEQLRTQWMSGKRRAVTVVGNTSAPGDESPEAACPQP